MEEVFAQLKCSREGLSSAEGEQRLQIFGPNKLEEKTVQSLFALLLLLHHVISARPSLARFLSFLCVCVCVCVTGEQVPQVLGLHVEPALLGHGDRRHHGHRDG